MEGRKVDLVKSYAFPGATAEDDLQSQLSQFLASQDSSKDTDNSSGARVSTLYGMLSRRSLLICLNWIYNCVVRTVLFIGINDVGSMPDEDDLEDMIGNTVMDAVHTLYVKAHARNFLLIDLPPMGRSPGGAYAYDL